MITRSPRLLTLVLLTLLLAACGQPVAPPTPTATSVPPTMVAPPTAAAPTRMMVPVLAISELNTGPNRIALGVLQDGTPIRDTELQIGMRFSPVGGEVAHESTAVYRGEGLPFGLYVGYATFDQPGAWNMEIALPQAGSEPLTFNMRLTVLATPNVPGIGQPAIPSQNLTIRDNPDLSQISSDPTPDPDFYQMTIAEAIAAKQPFVVGFLTPSFCQTAVCGPNMAVFKKLKEEYKDRINFIHVEVYPYPFGEAFQQQKLVEPMHEWNLVTEPWTFLVDANGIIQYRYEGGITFAEMEPALAQLAAGQPVTPLVP
ncbi:TlpA family protein disulfide reductase [Candidatus Oscillochloris fontis]|uniref:TlpA family protein disulfide reductase n=1 Tax=Candidatus Oscillochloris fontis TaxID=2496868 RepID=UPI00101CACBD|nr:thioredoxin family protein [Candidatus Oscillochloris fontis]